MNDNMNDDLESRLRRLGEANVSKLDESRVDAIATQMFAEPLAGRRPSWITAVAAACVLLVVAVTIALRDDGRNSLQPSNPTEDLVETTPPEPEPTSTVSTAVPPPTTTGTTNGTESTVRGTTSPTVTTAAPPTTAPPDAIPPASFALTVERVGNELHFSWPQYLGPDADRYVLIRIDGDRLASWPVPDSRIVVTTADLGTTNASVTLRTQPRRRWVLAVVGENRRLIAVSSTAISD